MRYEVIKTARIKMEFPSETVLCIDYSHGELNLSVKYVPIIKVEVEPQI